MATESVANDQVQEAYLGDTVRDAWDELDLPPSLQLTLASITRAVYGIRELTRLLAEDDFGREQIEDGVHFSPMTSGRRWSINHAIKQLLYDAELRLEGLPDEMKPVIRRHGES